MFIEQAQKVISAFNDRYVANYDSERSDYFEITVKDEQGTITAMFSIENYHLKAWIDEHEELHIINPETGESIFDYAEENGWDEEAINFMKLGTTKKGGRSWQDQRL